jgi:hypothetical protein
MQVEMESKSKLSGGKVKGKGREMSERVSEFHFHPVT